MTYAAPARVTLVAALAALACGHEPTVPSPMSAAGGIGPLCQLGCVETDPNPSAPGIVLGSGVSPDVCISGGYTDADQDGLGDFCEKNLARAFAPELYYSSADNVGREPHWAARIAPPVKVRLGYLLSYYRDEGSNAWGCNLPGAPSSCDGHNGDSEDVFLQVYYNDATQHWVVDSAWYSQHTAFGIYGRARDPSNYAIYTEEFAPLVYPSHPGSYPRVYVSEGKHANYAHVYECNGGGTFGTDTCEHVNTAARVVSGASLNIGSRAMHSSSQDCMQSSNPSYQYYGSGRLECYWTEARFRGWIPTWVGGADADPYTAKLESMGF